MRMHRREFVGGIAAVTIASCAPRNGAAEGKSTASPAVESFSPDLADIIDPAAQLETLATGFYWSEGPVWDQKRNRLYFSDVPQNTIFMWSQETDLEIFLKPSGLPEGEDPAPFDSAGINGMWIGKDGKLIAASHGKRAITRIDLDSKAETVLAGQYQGKLLNSPNDVIEDRHGNIYFTDPPYGLKDADQSPLKQQAINGVYRLTKNGSISLIDASLTRPNGIALSPDQRILYVAQSDPDRQILKSYAIAKNGSITDKGVFFDAQSLADDKAPGLPDGMCVAETGHIFATGPGGVLVLSPQGQLLGRINTGRACANCAFGDDGRTLYLTASDRLLRISLKVRGLGFN